MAVPRQFVCNHNFPQEQCVDLGADQMYRTSEDTDYAQSQTQTLLPPIM